MRNPKEIIINGKSLDKILEDHRHWIYRDIDNGGKMRADLSGADLSGADLSRVNLTCANLSGADLSGSNLCRTELVGTNLSMANLSGAYLTGADLYVANLSGANLCGAYMFEEACLNGADLSRAENIPFYPYACPDFGSFIGFKKAIGHYRRENIEVLVTLEIPEDAKRLSGTGRKCRCDKAKVLRITDLAEEIVLEEAYSDHDHDFYYHVGEIVGVSNFDKNRWNECSTGIHFFINKQEAINY